MSFVGKILYEIFRFPIVVLFRLSGWKLTRQTLEHDKLVMTGTPHTSNLDYLLFLLSALYLRRKIFVTIKSEVFFPPLGWILKAIGGIPVDRGSSQNLVEQLVKMIDSRERILLLFTPDGTRSYAEYLKTGFYWTAVEAGVPILSAIANYKTKTVHMHLLYEPSGDIEADIAVMREEQEKHGIALYPDKANPIRTRAAYEASLEETVETVSDSLPPSDEDADSQERTA